MIDRWWIQLAWCQLWQVTLTAAGIWLIVRVFARHRPRLAYLLWILVVVKCIAPPIWNSPVGLFSHLRLPAAPTPMVTESGFESQKVLNNLRIEIEPAPKSLTTNAQPSPQVADVPTATQTVSAAPNDGPSQTLLMSAAAPGSIAPAPTTLESAKPNSVRPSFSVETVALVLAAVWLIGSIVVAWRIAWKWMQFQRSLSKDTDTARIDEQLRILAKKLSLRQVPQVVATARLTVPAVFGFFRSTIVLPQQFFQPNSQFDLEPILAHELVHVRRGDTLAGRLQLFVQAVWWFHPLIWWVNFEARRERERACDEMVITLMGYQPLRYARCLVAIAELAERAHPGEKSWSTGGLAAVDSFTLLSNRLEHITQHSPKFSGRSPLMYSMTAILLAALLLPGGAITAMNQADSKLSSAANVASQPATKHFDEVDKNADQQLSLAEFLEIGGNPAVLKRDFQLFDLDGDRALSANEFTAVPRGQPAKQRGSLPDPLLELVDRVVSQLDESLDDWNRDLNREVPVQSFVESFLLLFPEPNFLPLRTADYVHEADPDQNQHVSRDEARRFIEIQMGVRRSDGKLLRFPNGQVVRFAMFLQFDRDGNDVIDRAEFFANWSDKTTVKQQWDLLDRDRDGVVPFEEFCTNSAGCGNDDPVEEFRKYDTNLDAFVDAEELRASSPAHAVELARHVFPGFDLDRDGKLNLSEFRQLPQSNFVQPWNISPVDRSRDEVIQFIEFTGRDAAFPLLRFVYFQRFDQNANGAIEPSELDFKIHQPDAFYRVNSNGTGWQLVYQSSQYCVLGSPRISPDGKWIVCDTFEKGGEGSWREMKLLMMTIDGKMTRKLGLGVLPNWSPDGRKLAFTFDGVQIIDLSLNRRRMLVPTGWSGQWSPDGKKIAYTEGAALRTIDPDTKEIATVLDGAANPYHSIFRNFGWSPDSNYLCFQGIRKDGRPEIATVSMVGDPDLNVLHDGTGDPQTNFAWSPNGQRVLFSWPTQDRSRMVLHEINPHKPSEPRPVRGLETTMSSRNSSWSPDGKFLIVHVRAE